MKQTTLNLDLSLKRTRKREFLEQMNHVVPWAELVVNQRPTVSSFQHLEIVREPHTI